MRFTSLQPYLKNLATENASTILTAAGVVGTVGTAVLTHRAATKASEIVREASSAERIKTNDSQAELSKFEKVRLTGHLYVPPVACGSATIASIILANRITTTRAAALAAAYGISQRQLDEYQQKVVEKLGGKKEQELRDELHQDRVTRQPPGREVTIIANGDVICLDQHSGRYFRNTVESIRKAESAVNREIHHHMFCSLSFFYDEIGLPPTGYSDEVGWNANHALEIYYSTAMTPDEQPCMVIEFVTPPVAEYARLYG